MKKNIFCGRTAWALGCLLVLLPLTLSAKDSPTGLDLARELNHAFIEVAEKVSPAVVVVTVTQKPESFKFDDEERNPLDLLPPEMRRYFRHRMEEPPEKSYGQGSGVIIREDGFILTNRHVVDDTEKIEVRLKDGRVFKAEVRGVDPQSDIAVIKIDAKGLPVARLADSSKTRVGEFAIAIGAPFELDYSVTFGHVSAKGRKVLSDRIMMDQDFIQTDASINPGNSGGPLVNIEGEVMGINSMIRGMQTGIGFAVPMNLAKEVADKLISEGKFTRGWLGVYIETLRESQELKDRIKGVADGVVIKAIDARGPAAKSALEPEDVVTAVDGKAVSTAQDLKNEIRIKKIGQSVNLDVVRDGRNIKVKVQPEEYPEDRFAANRGSKSGNGETANRLGISVKSLTSEAAKEFGVEKIEGVVVTEVETGSLAAKHGIKQGDVITKVDRKKVTSPKEFREAMKTADVKKGVTVSLVGEEGRRFEILKDSGD
ncbi:MAG: trypsin-like peptidase domain-containing protein [Verrucomicrobia bacterium]|nr:trypsin-like peptidase domain-containing protein [Verrucomicrobiota bacterium]